MTSLHNYNRKLKEIKSIKNKKNIADNVLIKKMNSKYYNQIIEITWLFTYFSFCLIFSCSQIGQFKISISDNRRLAQMREKIN